MVLFPTRRAIINDSYEGGSDASKTNIPSLLNFLVNAEEVGDDLQKVAEMFLHAVPQSFIVGRTASEERECW